MYLIIDYPGKHANKNVNPGFYPLHATMVVLEKISEKCLMPKISVLVPIFNVEKYLEECLDSIINQTLRDIEIVCINDGSTDSSLDIIKRYAKNDPRFVVINKKNSGYGDSMNKGITKATGDFIGIVESDDFIEPNMFEKLYKLALKHDAEVVKSEFYYYYTDLSDKSPQWDATIGGVYNRDQQRLITKHNTKSNIIHPQELDRVIDTTKHNHIFYQKPAIWSAIYRRDFLAKNGIKFLASPGASYQDTAFSFKVWSCATRVVFTNEAFLHYRQDNEASSINSPGKVFCVADEYEEIEKFLKAKNLYEDFGSLAQKTKYGAYSWNFSRLTDGLDADFLKVFSKQYKEAEENGVLDYFFFDINERRILKEIINNPEMTLKRKYARKAAKISVIVPVYNVEKYLRKSLDSLVNQTLEEIEIICVNDGSPDNSSEILEEYYAKDPRIVVRDTSNRGLAAARNHGVAQATSDFLMFCDSDDSYNLKACETMYKAITKNDTDIAIAGTNIVYNTPALAKQYRKSDEEYYRLRLDGKVKITDSIIKKTDVSAWNKIYRTAIQRKYEIWFPKGMWYEDVSFFNSYMLVSNTAYYLKDKKLYNYVRRDGSIMSETSLKTPKALDHTRVAIQLFTFMKRNDLLKDHSKTLVHTLTEGYCFSERHMPKQDHEKLHELMRNFIKSNKNHLDSDSIEDLKKLPPAVPYKITVKRAVKRVVKKPAKSILSLSPMYRRQSHIMAMVDDLGKKIDTSNKHIERLQSEINELKNSLK